MINITSCLGTAGLSVPSSLALCADDAQGSDCAGFLGARDFSVEQSAAARFPGQGTARLFKFLAYSLAMDAIS